MNRSAVTKFVPALPRWVKAGTAGVGALALSTMARAQASGGGIDSMFDAIDLSGISAKVVALGLLIVGIALVFKGPALAKRIINKI